MAVNKIPSVKELAQKNLVQTKILSANVTSNGTISDLTFNNLTIGKFYEVRGQVLLSNDDGGTNNTSAMIAVHNSVTLNQAYLQVGDGSAGTDFSAFALSFIFKAEATSLTFEGSLLDANSQIRGTNDRAGTYVQLEERNDLRETDKF